MLVCVLTLRMGCLVFWFSGGWFAGGVVDVIDVWVAWFGVCDFRRFCWVL